MFEFYLWTEYFKLLVRDEHLEIFLAEFGEATRRIGAARAVFQVWRGRLPQALLEYWMEEGWSGYSNGLLWIVNPGEYEELVDMWLKGTPLEKYDRFHVIARTGFGKLYLWGEKTGHSADILPWQNSIMCLERSLKRTMKDPNLMVRATFSGIFKSDLDLLDERRQLIFDAAVKKLGELQPDEMYGFEPALVVGGKLDVNNLRKVKIQDHLSMLRQLAEPTLPLLNLEIGSML